MKKIAPNISDQSAQFYLDHFRNLNAGSTFILDAFPTIYKREIATVKGIFTRGELCLMIDCFNGLLLTPQLIGQHIELQVIDSINLDHTDEKWGIAKAEIINKIAGLSFFEKVCLEIWVKAFWNGNREGQEAYQKNDIEEYVKKLI